MKYHKAWIWVLRVLLSYLKPVLHLECHKPKVWVHYLLVLYMLLLHVHRFADDTQLYKVIDSDYPILLNCCEN